MITQLQIIITYAVMMTYMANLNNQLGSQNSRWSYTFLGRHYIWNNVERPSGVVF